MAPPSSSPSLPPHPSHLFTPIQEGNESEETDERHRFDSTTTPTTASSACTDPVMAHHHHPTPLHEPGKKPNSKPRRNPDNNHRSVSCNNCRPTHHRDKTSMTVVPLDNHHHLPLPSPTNGLFKSLLSGISRRKPPSPSPPLSSPMAEPRWRVEVEVAELTHKLTQATRKRDEAILESSRLKHSLTELEKKLNRLEVYCHSLKSGLDICTKVVPSPTHNNAIINNFLGSVSDARSSIRFLSRSLASQLKLMGGKVIERLAMLLRSYDIKLSVSPTASNFRSMQFYLEALLNAAFFEDFETVGFAKNSTNAVLNPIDRCEASYSGYAALKDLAWEEVLSKGTRHFSEEFSRFCDRKMSEIVALLGWNRAWPEQLLQAFFGASKSVWLVHLLANSVHPSLTVFRVGKGVRFDPVYMEDMGGDKAKKLLLPTVVRIMVTPGFYVYDNVVKCKVLCRYYDSNYNGVFSGIGDGNRVSVSPP